MINIILCGGSGTRLWPLSRKKTPKQFLKLFEKKSLFQMCVQRNENICSKQFIVSNVDQYFLAQEQLEELDKEDTKYLLEEIGRNTAPALALACMTLDYDDIVLVTPSDHLIKNQPEYVKVVNEAKLLAANNNLVTFGIKPSYAETGYGYIEADGSNVKNFHEKPDEIKAQMYIKSQDYFWNSGIFCFKAGVYLDELKKYTPEIYIKSMEVSSKVQSSKIQKISQEDMLSIPEDSIDYAVMEKSLKVKMVKSDINWSDLGTFESLNEVMHKDSNDNTKLSTLYGLNAKNNFIYAQDKIVALIDVEDLVIVDTPDALLISKKGSSAKVKEIIKELQIDNNKRV